MKKIVFSLSLTYGMLISFSGITQPSSKWNKYSISKSINISGLDYKKLPHGKGKAAIENNIADFYLTKNGLLVKPPKDSLRNYFVSGCICFKFDDTLLLNSGLGKKAGVGVAIKIYKDKFTGTLHANAGSNLSYKSKKSDTAYTRDYNAQPEKQSLKLYERPTFTADEIVVGEYDATYKTFYQKSNQKDEVRKYQVRLIFKCKSTGMDSMSDATKTESK